MHDIVAAHKHSSNHRDEVERSEKCGCFYCLSILTPSSIVEWIDEPNDNSQTALCPKCGVDSVIGSESMFPITTEFLTAMHQHWF